MSAVSHFGRPQIDSDELSARSASRGALVASSSLVLQGGLRMAFTVVVARLLGPDGYADFGFALAICTLVTIVWPASAGAAFSRFVNRAHGAGKSEDKHLAAAHLLRRQILFLCLALPSVGLVVLAWRNDASLAAAMCLLAAGLSSQVFGRGVHTALGLLTREAILQAVAGACALALIWCLVISPLPLSAALAAAVLGAAFAAYGVAIWPAGVRRSRGHSSELAREIDAFVVLAALGSVASAGLPQLSIIYADWLLTTEAAGAYAVAVSFALPINLAASALGMVLYPRMARLQGLEAGSVLDSLRSRATGLLMAGGILALTLGGAVTEWIVDVLLGEKFSDTGAVTLILVLGVLFTAVASPSVSLLSTRSNRALRIASIASWVGLIFAVGVWALAAATATQIACGYAAATWITATSVIFRSHRLTGGKGLAPWLLWSTAASVVVASYVVAVEPWTQVVGLVFGTLLALTASASQTRRTA